MCIMRTTLTIPDELAEAAKQMTGHTSLSDAITEIVSEKLRIQRQLKALEFMRNNPPDITYKQIKAMRKGRRWSA